MIHHILHSTVFSLQQRGVFPVGQYEETKQWSRLSFLSCFCYLKLFLQAREGFEKDQVAVLCLSKSFDDPSSA